ncbi:MAG: methyltransferase domain-containing protein [Candidatus Zixiibacteriota bacterium]
MSHERDYVLGTHDEEVDRLGLQHRVWRPRASAAWRKAGFTVGQTLLDLGCGPGYASVDLAEIVGPEGRIIAIDRSRRFLDVLEATRRQRGLDQITTLELDLDLANLPEAGADGAWSRWVFSFVKHPRALLERVAGSLKPRGVLAMHEYFAYATWEILPKATEFEEFVRVVMDTWRDEGGEADIGLDLPIWLGELGFEIRSLESIIEIVRPTDFVWQWPKAFVEVGLKRLVDLGRMTQQRATEILTAFQSREASPHALMITPAVLEIIAVLR